MVNVLESVGGVQARRNILWSEPSMGGHSKKESLGNKDERIEEEGHKNLW